MQIVLSQNPETTSKKLKALGINQTLVKEVVQMAQQNNDPMSFVSKNPIPTGAVSPALLRTKNAKVLKKVFIKHRIFNFMQSKVTETHYGFFVKWSNGVFDTIEVAKKTEHGFNVQMLFAFNLALLYALTNMPDSSNLGFMNGDIVTTIDSISGESITKNAIAEMTKVDIDFENQVITVSGEETITKNAVIDSALKKDRHHFIIDAEEVPTEESDGLKHVVHDIYGNEPITAS